MPHAHQLSVSARACLVVLCFAAPASAQTTFTVTTEAALRTAITTAAAGDTIQIATNILLTTDLPSIATSVTIDGGGFTLSGNSQYRGLVVVAMDAGGPATTPVTVTIQNITITDTVASGGDGGSGGSGGGGGAGLGGAVYVGDQASVTLSNVNIASSSATGGDGGSGGGAGAAGGGGLGGAGGSGTATAEGGGGGAGTSATGGSGTVGGTGILTAGSPAGYQARYATGQFTQAADVRVRFK